MNCIIFTLLNSFFTHIFIGNNCNFPKFDNLLYAYFSRVNKVLVIIGIELRVGVIVDNIHIHMRVTWKSAHISPIDSYRS